MRGTDGVLNCEIEIDRFIPACAGNRISRVQNSPRNSVHPRVCGEQSSASVRRYASNGSSPRVRGTDEDPAPVCHPRRFIPACAGNRAADPLGRGVQTVHPRVCGEQPLAQASGMVVTGSSPRVRGTARFVRRFKVTPRFIPACAGNSTDRVLDLAAGSVHPRVCGEQLITVPGVRIPGGSSPRVRGTAVRWGLAYSARRFIPACAGNSRS